MGPGHSEHSPQMQMYLVGAGLRQNQRQPYPGSVDGGLSRPTVGALHSNSAALPLDCQS